MKPGNPDISTLEETGHLYFGPTRAGRSAKGAACLPSSGRGVARGPLFLPFVAVKDGVREVTVHGPGLANGRIPRLSWSLPGPGRGTRRRETCRARDLVHGRRDGKRVAGTATDTVGTRERSPPGHSPRPAVPETPLTPSSSIRAENRRRPRASEPGTVDGPVLRCPDADRDSPPARATPTRTQTSPAPRCFLAETWIDGRLRPH